MNALLILKQECSALDNEVRAGKPNIYGGHDEGWQLGYERHGVIWNRTSRDSEWWIPEAKIYKSYLAALQAAKKWYGYSKRPKRTRHAFAL